MLKVGESQWVYSVNDTDRITDLQHKKCTFAYMVHAVCVLCISSNIYIVSVSSVASPFTGVYVMRSVLRNAEMYCKFN